MWGQLIGFVGQIYELCMHFDICIQKENGDLNITPNYVRKVVVH